MTRKERRSFTPEFKEHIVKLYQSGKPRKEILLEYELGSSTFDRWVYQFNHSGSFKHSDNLSDVEKENILLKKELKQAQMELDILKQATLIMSRK